MRYDFGRAVAFGLEESLRVRQLGRNSLPIPDGQRREDKTNLQALLVGYFADALAEAPVARFK